MRSRSRLTSPASPERWSELLAVAASAKKSTKGGPPVILFLFTFAKSKGFRKNIFPCFLCNQPGSDPHVYRQGQLPWSARSYRVPLPKLGDFKCTLLTNWPSAPTVRVKHGRAGARGPFPLQTAAWSRVKEAEAELDRPQTVGPFTVQLRGDSVPGGTGHYSRSRGRCSPTMNQGQERVPLQLGNMTAGWILVP